MTEKKELLMESLTRCILEKLSDKEVTDKRVKVYVDDLRDSLRQMIAVALKEIKDLQIEVMNDDFDIDSPDKYPEFQAVILRHYIMGIKAGIDEAIEEQFNQKGDKK